MSAIWPTGPPKLRRPIFNQTGRAWRRPGGFDASARAAMEITYRDWCDWPSGMDVATAMWCSDAWAREY